LCDFLINLYLCVYVSFFLDKGSGICSYTYIHTYIYISFRRFTNSVVTTVGRETCQIKKKTHNTQTKQMTQYNMNKQMSVLQSPKSNTVHNVKIKI
jgi:hypothetical protein